MHAARSQCAHDGPEVKPAGVGARDSDSVRLEVGACGRVIRMKDEGSSTRGQDACVRWTSELGVQDDRQGIPAALSTRVQARVVCPQRACAHHHRVVLVSKSVPNLARGLARDPLTVALSVRDSAVQRDGRLHGDPRSSALLGGEVCTIQRTTCSLLDADPHGNTGRLKDGDPLALHPLIGVHHADDDLGDPRSDDGVRARRCASLVTARLEVHHHRGALRLAAELIQRIELRMRGTRGSVPAFREGLAVTQDDGTHHRIGRRATPSLGGELNAALHPDGGCHLLSGSRSTHGCSSWRNSSADSISWYTDANRR